MAGQGKVSARAKAREAMAARAAKQKQREKQIEDSAAEFFRASGEVVSAEQALATAQAGRVAALASLSDLGLTTDEVVELTGVDAADVRAARKEAKDTPQRSAVGLAQTEALPGA